MATFTKDLPEVTNRIGVQKPVADRSDETLLKGLGGMALQAAPLFIQAKENAKKQQGQEALNQFETDVVALREANDSPVIQAFDKDVKTINAKAKQTGRSSNLVAQIEARAGQAIAQNPELAPEIRKRVDKMIGFNLTKHQFDKEQKQAEMKEKFNRELIQGEVQFGVDNGLAAYDVNGQLDIDKTISQTRKFRSNEAKLAQIKQSNDLTDPQKQSSLNVFALDTMEDSVASALDSLNAIAPNLEGLDEKTQFNELATMVNSLEQQTRRTISRAALEQGFKPSELGEVDQLMDRYFAPVKELFTGTLSDVETTKRNLELLKNGTGITVAKSMDTMLKLEAVLGQRAVGDILGAALTLGDTNRQGVKQKIIQEFDAFMEQGKDVGGVEAFHRILSEGMPINQPSPKQAKEALTMTKEMFKSTNRNRTEIGKREVANYIAGTNAFSQAGLNSPKDLQNAANTFDSTWRSGFTSIVNSGQASPFEQELIADSARTTSLAYLLNTSQTVNVDAEAAGFSLVYDTATGTVSAVSDTTKGGVAESIKDVTGTVGFTTGVTGQLVGRAVSDVVDIVSPNKAVMDRKVKEINNALKTVSATKDYDRGLKSMSDLQVMELVSINMGIGVKGNSTLPDGTDTTQLPLEKSFAEQRNRILTENSQKIKEIRQELNRGLEDITRIGQGISLRSLDR